MATLREVFTSLFPDTPGERPFEYPPLMPTDIFAFVAHALERSGAYHHIAPEVIQPPRLGTRQLIVTEAMRERASLLGRQWRTAAIEPGRRLPEVPGGVTLLWQSLAVHSETPVFLRLEDDAAAPGWWSICFELLIACDEACEDLGFTPGNPFFAIVMDEYEEEAFGTHNVFHHVQSGPFSLSSAAEDLVCVQAKSRTPSVGCTLRSLTHHLALLPPRGQVRARWVQPVFGDGSKQDDKELGLLLVPFPYRISDDAFRASGVDPDGHFGWFEVEQSWLPKGTDRYRRLMFADFIVDLIAEARAKGARVDAVVLPELALDYRQFLTLANRLARDAGIDFIISGISTNKAGRKGNFVAIIPFFLLGRQRDPEITGWQNLILIREKHHRWKLSQSQIEAYGLTELTGGHSWWEDLAILSRSIDLLVYRGNTTLTTLICEDLARVDPCQAVIRGVGPNLLIALLMDGPQLGDRWAARYATVLAEDPGTSVLTFTSFGLLARQNDRQGFGQSSSIGLWKDEVSGVTKLELHREADAILLSLKATQKEERTLDGRRDGGSSLRWEYDGHMPVSAASLPDWVRNGQAR